MNVLVTGAYGRCGTALIDHLHDSDNYDFTYYNRSDRPPDHRYGGFDTVVGDVADAQRIERATRDTDTLIHMAAYPYTDGSWGEVLKSNIIGTFSVLNAARTNEIERVVFLSSNHVMGKYEEEHAPELYEPGYGLLLDHTSPVRPDSYYGVSKSFGEDMGRYFVEEYSYPQQFLALRTGTVNWHEFDHPYGNAEAAVAAGEVERGDDEYERKVKRMKCTWQSRRDFAHQIECCLANDTLPFGIFYGVSDNARRWFDIEDARSRIGYDPQDAAEDWDGPPGD